MDDGIADTFVSVDGASGVGCYSAMVSRFTSLAEAAIAMLEIISLNVKSAKQEPRQFSAERSQDGDRRVAPI